MLFIIKIIRNIGGRTPCQTPRKQREEKTSKKIRITVTVLPKVPSPSLPLFSVSLLFSEILANEVFDGRVLHPGPKKELIIVMRSLKPSFILLQLTWTCLAKEKEHKGKGGRLEEENSFFWRSRV